jgi:biotin transporter BioY
MSLVLTKSPTYAEMFKPKEKVYQIIYEIGLVIVISLLIGICANIKIFLPYTMVPVTLQTFAVLFFSLLLGARRSLYVLLAYIFEGMVGLPVFSKGSGVSYLLGPTGGYILGFLASGYVVGFLAEHGFEKNFFTTIFALVIGNIIIYFFGILWLAKFVSGINNAVKLGVIPFLVVDSIKILFCATIFPLSWRVVKKYKL